MNAKKIILVSDQNDLAIHLKEELQNVLRTELQFLRKSQKQNSAIYLTRSDVASLLHVSFSTLNRFSQSGMLKAYKFGKRTLFRSTDVEEMLIQINSNTKGGTNYEY